MVDENFDCSKCMKKWTQHHRDSRKGCSAPVEKKVAEWSEYLAFYRCPGALKSQYARELVFVHGLFDQGVLPFNGGLFDQPSKMIDAMSLIAGLKSEHYEDLRKKAEKKAKADQRNGR
jgi:hypothetical protein